MSASLYLCISWMVLCGMFIFHAPWLFILTVQWSQHVYYLHICVVNKVVRTFLMFWCWNRFLRGSPLSWNLLYPISFTQLLWWMMLLLLMSVVLPRGIFFLSCCVWVSYHLRKKCTSIGVGFCISMILKEVKAFSQFLNALLVYLSLFTPYNRTFPIYVLSSISVIHSYVSVE